MRQVSHLKIVVLIACLLFTGSLIFMRSHGKAQKYKLPLEQAVSHLGKWRKINSIPLSKKVIRALKLDDYVFQTYTKGAAPVTLYVGYYRDGTKVGAAHHPLVCFPGEGWNVSNVKNGRLPFFSKGNHDIHYSSFIVEKDGQKELVYYWFQADSFSTDSTFIQKLSLFWQELMKKGQNSAFVRVSTPLNGTEINGANKRIVEFINKFYPVFFRYVTS